MDLNLDRPPLNESQANTLVLFEAHRFESIKPEDVAKLPGGGQLLLLHASRCNLPVLERRWTFLLERGYVTPAELLAHARECYARVYRQARWRKNDYNAPEWTECPFYTKWIAKCTALVNEK